MRVWAEADDKAVMDWVRAAPVRVHLQMMRFVTEGINSAHRYMLGPEVLGKWPNPHADVYPPPAGMGEVPGKYWSAPRTVPTRVTGQLVNSVTAPATRTSGFGVYERSVGPRVWYARKQELGFYSTRFKTYISPRPFSSRTASWLVESTELDKLINNAVDQMLR